MPENTDFSKMNTAYDLANFSEWWKWKSDWRKLRRKWQRKTVKSEQNMKRKLYIVNT